MTKARFARITTGSMFSNLRVFQIDVDFPNVPSNGAASGDITASSVILGTHILSFSPVSDATDIDDLQITFLVVAAGLIRFTLSNPTGGAIDPGVITMQFFMADINQDLVTVA